MCQDLLASTGLCETAVDSCQARGIRIALDIVGVLDNVKENSRLIK